MARRALSAFMHVHAHSNALSFASLAYLSFLSDTHAQFTAQPNDDEHDICGLCV